MDSDKNMIGEEDVRQEMAKITPDEKEPDVALSYMAGFLAMGGEMSLGAKPKVSLVLRDNTSARLAAACLSVLYAYHPDVTISTHGRQRSYSMELPIGVSHRLLLDCHMAEEDEEGRTIYMPGAMASMRWVRRGAYCAALYLEGGRLYAGDSYRLDLVLPFGGRRQKELESIFAHYEITWHQVPSQDKLRLSLRRESVATFLALIGASASSLALTAYYIERNVNRTVNRNINCSTNNMDKAFRAAANQLWAVNRLKDVGRYVMLPADVRAVGDMRVANPEASLQQIADMMQLNKTAVYRRMKVITDAALAYQGE